MAKLDDWQDSNSCLVHSLHNLPHNRTPPMTLANHCHKRLVELEMFNKEKNNLVQEEPISYTHDSIIKRLDILFLPSVKQFLWNLSNAVNADDMFDVEQVENL